ncbi:synaptopodin [Mustelus asterias]
MQVEADVHSCGYFTQAPVEPEARWSAGKAESPLSSSNPQRQENHLGNWGDGEEGPARDAEAGTDKENGATGTLAPNSTFSEVAARPLPCALREGDCPLNIRAGQCAPSKPESRGKGRCRAPKVVPPPAMAAVAPHHRPASISRSLSLSEQEAKDARIQSQRIAAQLTTPPSTNSKGVLLFNKRKKRVNEFTLTSYGQQQQSSGLGVSGPVDGEGRADRLDRTPGSADSSSEETSTPSFKQRVKGGNMEATLTVGNHEYAGALEEEAVGCGSEDEREEQRSEGGAGETEAAEEHVAVQSTMNATGNHLLETSNVVKQARTTMEVRLKSSHSVGDTDNKVYMDLPREVNHQTDGDKTIESQVAYVPEEKPALVANRTPRPFLSEGASPKPYKPPVGPPEGTANSPVYSPPPPVSRMTSPPPCATSNLSAVGQGARPPVMWANKTGILEESRMRRAGRKPMFTFYEKPKVAPNPELLSLVQGIDVKKKNGQGEALTEEDYLGLGAEAATFTQQKTAPPVAPKPTVSSQADPPIPEWASCLKPPELRAPRRSGATQALAEVKGKGAELFARRQSRMERYTIESSPAKENQPQPRPPSPTMSLPPSWKCHDERRSPPSFNHKSLHLGSRSPPSAFAQVDKANSNHRPPGDAAKHQPHQLISSLFIISPEKSPLTSLPRGAPSPPRPIFPGTSPYVRQTSAAPFCPPTAAKPPPSSGLNGFANHSPGLDLGASSFQPTPASPSSSPAPRSRDVPQAPRPSFSTRKAGLEAQVLTSPTAWKPSIERRMSSPRLYTDTFRTLSASEYRPGSPKSPFYPISPPATALFNNWSPLREAKVGSPSRPGGDSTENRRLKDLLAKNVVSAARRKKLSSPTASPTSPGDLPPSPSPRAGCLSPLSPLSPSVASPDTPATCVRSPLRLYRRSLTDSEFSLGSDDSGPRSPSYYNFCPRGWTGSKLKQSEQL